MYRIFERDTVTKAESTSRPGGPANPAGTVPETPGHPGEHRSAAAEVTRTLADITAAALAAIPGAEYAGITLVQRRGGVRPQGATHAVAGILDRIEPCDSPGATAIREQRTITVHDLGAGSNWPRFAAMAGELGVRGVLSLPLRARERTIGALQLYATTVDAFNADAETVAGVFAARAAFALRGTELTDAVADRAAIGQATGSLMARHHATAAGAAEILARTARDAHRDVADLAGELIADARHPKTPSRPVLRTRAASRLTVVELDGDIDALTAPRLREYLARLPATDTLVDLSQVTFLAIAGLRLLRQRRAELGVTGHTLRVTGAAPGMHRVLALAGLREEPAWTGAAPAVSTGTGGPSGPGSVMAAAAVRQCAHRPQPTPGQGVR